MAEEEKPNSDAGNKPAMLTRKIRPLPRRRGVASVRAPESGKEPETKKNENLSTGADKPSLKDNSATISKPEKRAVDDTRPPAPGLSPDESQPPAAHQNAKKQRRVLATPRRLPSNSARPPIPEPQPKAEIKDPHTKPEQSSADEARQKLALEKYRQLRPEGQRFPESLMHFPPNWVGSVGLTRDLLPLMKDLPAEIEAKFVGDILGIQNKKFQADAILAVSESPCPLRAETYGSFIDKTMDLLGKEIEGKRPSLEHSQESNVYRDLVRSAARFWVTSKEQRPKIEAAIDKDPATRKDFQSIASKHWRPLNDDLRLSVSKLDKPAPTKPGKDKTEDFDIEELPKQLNSNARSSLDKPIAQLSLQSSNIRQSCEKAAEGAFGLLAQEFNGLIHNRQITPMNTEPATEIASKLAELCKVVPLERQNDFANTLTSLADNDTKALILYCVADHYGGMADAPRSNLMSESNRMASLPASENSLSKYTVAAIGKAAPFCSKQLIDDYKRANPSDRPYIERYERMARTAESRREMAVGSIQPIEKMNDWENFLKDNFQNLPGGDTKERTQFSISNEAISKLVQMHDYFSIDPAHTASRPDRGDSLLR